jgi:phosphotransferase system IIA component
LYASEIVAPVATPTPALVPAKHAIFLPEVIG